MTVAKCFSGELLSIETNGLKSQLLRMKTKNVPDGCHLLFNKVKAFEPVPFSADRIVLRSYQPATILSLSVTSS